MALELAELGGHFIQGFGVTRGFKQRSWRAFTWPGGGRFAQSLGLIQWLVALVSADVDLFGLILSQVEGWVVFQKLEAAYLADRMGQVGCTHPMASPLLLAAFCQHLALEGGFTSCCQPSLAWGRKRQHLVSHVRIRRLFEVGFDLRLSK